MAVLVQLTGEPGTGKSFSVKTLSPKDTYIIDTDGQGLAWAGWRKDYGSDKKNYTTIPETCKQITALLQKISTDRPDIKQVVVDTISSTMSDEEVAALKRPSHNIWRDYAVDVYEMYSACRKLRNDLVIIFVAHPMVSEGADFRPKLVTKTGGKKLTRLNLNGKLNYNLFTQVERSGKDDATYWFTTQSDGINEARSVHGVLDYKIPNDLGAVVKAIRTKDLGV